jgi:hypothetical protein
VFSVSLIDVSLIIASQVLFGINNLLGLLNIDVKNCFILSTVRNDNGNKRERAHDSNNGGIRTKNVMNVYRDSGVKY